MSSSKVVPILSTAGAVPIRNEKGEISMQKVKVNRYVSGKRPDYAVHSSSEGSEDEEFIRPRRARLLGDQQGDESPKDAWEYSPEVPAEAQNDRRLKRLQNREVDDDRLERHRHIHEPEILDTEGANEAGEEEVESEIRVNRRWESSEEEDEAEDLNEDDIEHRRMIARQKAVVKQKEEELLAREEEKETEDEEDEEASEYEEYTDSEEDTGPRLKPVFVSQKDRITIAEKEIELQKKKQQEIQSAKMAEERRRQTLKMVEQQVNKEMQVADEKSIEAGILAVITDDEDGELEKEKEYESWKLRELRRIKRNREDREAEEKDRQEIERVRNMTEEERRAEFKNNPKMITNKAPKGKYKFLQKYYHRGAFYLDDEDQVYKRDFAVPTLEDHFNKTVLPKVMQVKNFGRSGRTKYTHLVDQDTSQSDAPWASHTAQNLKFHTQHAGGVKQVFERPALKRNKSSAP